MINSAPPFCLIRPRVTLPHSVMLGPGKADLLQAIEVHGSISAAGRALGMGYRRAWTLLDEMQQAFGEPMVTATAGGIGGGGSQVTVRGRAVLALYRELEIICDTATQDTLRRLAALVQTLEEPAMPKSA